MCYIIFCIPIQINNIRTILYVTINVLFQHALAFIKIWMRNNYYYSSSIGTTARCGLWSVKQCPSIFSYLATNSPHLLTPSTWRSLTTSSFHLFLGLPPFLVPSSSWVKIFLGILSSILSRWPNQLILCPFICFTIFSPLLFSSSSRFVRLFHSPFSHLGPYILLSIFLSKIRASSFIVNAHASAPYDTTGLI